MRGTNRKIVTTTHTRPAANTTNGIIHNVIHCTNTARSVIVYQIRIRRTGKEKKKKNISRYYFIKRSLNRSPRGRDAACRQRGPDGFSKKSKKSAVGTPRARGKNKKKSTAAADTTPKTHDTRVSPHGVVTDTMFCQQYPMALSSA